MLAVGCWAENLFPDHDPYLTSIHAGELVCDMLLASRLSLLESFLKAHGFGTPEDGGAGISLASAAGGECMAIPGIVDHSPQVTDLEPCLELAGLRWRFDCPEYSGGPPQPWMEILSRWTFLAHQRQPCCWSCAHTSRAL